MELQFRFSIKDALSIQAINCTDLYSYLWFFSPQTGSVENEPSRPGHGTDGSRHPECRNALACRLEQNRFQHRRERRSVHVLRSNASKS